MTKTKIKMLARLDRLDPATGMTTPMTRITRHADGVPPFQRGDVFAVGEDRYVVLEVKAYTAERATQDGPEMETAYTLVALPLNDRGDWPSGQ